ncbi:MAG: argininosuccinate synthase [Clostridia bacterium]|nr:argininosuccinate synthase [Clostridia bacterium]
MLSSAGKVKKVVLAYSGGLDTSVAIKWLQESYGAEVLALAVDVGAKKDLDVIQKKALAVGAVKSLVADARKSFVLDYVYPCLKANAMYEGKYPLTAAISRPLISKLLVEMAHQECADAVAHGCTGKGNDQVRFDVSIQALDPSLAIIAPVREWPMSREKEIEYAEANNIPVPVTVKSPYSVDENLWGRSAECGVLEDPWVEPPADAYAMTTDPSQAPDEPEYLDIDFEHGVPVRIDGEAMDPVDMIEALNVTAGRHGVGRLDMVENRLVGIKSREIYEAPAATVLIAAHQDLETLTMPRETLHFKKLVEQKYSEVVYFGLWYSPLRDSLDAFIDSTQKSVSGTVKVKLYRGTCTVVGRRSPHSLYDYSLATYDKGDRFDHSAAVGFINVWGLPTKVARQAERRTASGTCTTNNGVGGSAE